jgi:26S proteasome regulatory subunit (ATPase 3-interacting protein)
VDTAETETAAEEEIQTLQDKFSTMKCREKELRERLVALSAIISIKQLREQVAQLEKEKQSFLERLSKIQAETTARIGIEETTRIDDDWKTWQHHVQHRKRIFHDLWRNCTEVLPDDTTEEELRVCRLPCAHFMGIIYFLVGVGF